MDTIAFFNLKGGVGKTTSAVNIAWHAAQEGIPTLLWDLDPQGAASWFLQRHNDDKIKAKKLLSGKTPIGDLVESTDYPDLDIIPANFSYRHFDHLLGEKNDNQIAKLVQPFAENYALMILDCPPSFSHLTEQIFETADSLFLPLIPSHLSLRTYEQTREFFKENKLKSKRLYGFFNMVDIRRSMHRNVLEQAPNVLKKHLNTYIPYAATAERMGEYQAPVPVFDKQSPISTAYAALWQEIKATLHEQS